MTFFRIFAVLFSILFAITNVVHSQESIQIELKWEAPKEFIYQDKSIKMPSIEGQESDNGKPVHFYRQKLKSENYEVVATDFSATAASSFEISYLNDHNFHVPNDVEIDLSIRNASHEPYLVSYLFPFFVDNGIVKRINSFKINLSPKAPIHFVNKDFVANSVLQTGSGEWYKISVKNDGFHKIDKAFLQSCGINTDGLDPASINIYGNGEGKMPELNSVPRTDDLAVNAIYIEGETDGTFDETDYIIFYGWGPNRWYPNGLVEFEQDKNIYSDVSIYFININPSGTPVRISDLPVSSGTVNQNVDSYSYFDVHEQDLVSLVKGGQRWYGELFDTQLEGVFTFSVPNIVSTSPAFFKTAIASNGASSAGTSQEYSVNGTVLSSSGLPAVSGDFGRSAKTMTLNSPPAIIPFKVSITRNSPSTLTYLDRIVLNARRKISFIGQQFNFRDLNSVALGNVTEFTVSNFPASGYVWDVTNRHVPLKVSGTLSGSDLTFIAETDTLREFAASNGLNFLTPEFVEIVTHQNLHSLPQADYLIVSNSGFMSEANRLADLHRSKGLTVHVVTTQQVFNEFSSGMLDPTAIRMFVKMFYDRAILNPGTEPKFLLLFGDGTYDPKNRISGNNNYVLTYQMENGENHIDALVTDDYFGMLDENESISEIDQLDIGIGRLLISDLNMAKQQVDKIEHYMMNGSSLFSSNQSGDCSVVGKSSTYGDWRLNYVQIADDEEGGYFINNDTEPQYKYVKANVPEMNCDKLYTDAFTQVSTAGGQRYPDVFEAITNRNQRGALLMNYVGHGGEVGLAEERIVTVPQIQSWTNIDKLNIFASATCEFTKFDDPSRVSAGEWASLNPNGSAIALMTTTRSVFFGVNTITGKRFFENVFSRDAEFKPKHLGEIIMLTKNAAGSSDNKRSFTLIGDPALRLALPEMKVVTDSINGLSTSIEIDTIRALSKMTIKGHLEDFNGTILTGFNGVLSPSIFDKPKTLYTLGQDNFSPVIPFELQRNVVYKGKATVTNGYFEFSFIVPKDINFAYGAGKISYYANSTNLDAGGLDTNFIIGGIDPNGINDVVGPTIDLFLNDENFVNGGMTNETPILIAKIFDENGVNTVGNGIGHDITLIIDANTADPIILNDYYSADLDSYQSGSINFTMSALSPGNHNLTLKVWDVNNNSSEATLDFVVQEQQQIALDHVLNYPNPFTTRTEFFFEHNQVCTELETQLQIFTVSGKLVKTINEIVHTEGFRSNGIPWDGKDEFGDQLAKGVYVYVLSVKSSDGSTAEKTEKLVLLK